MKKLKKKVVKIFNRKIKKIEEYNINLNKIKEDIK